MYASACLLLLLSFRCLVSHNPYSTQTRTLCTTATAQYSQPSDSHIVVLFPCAATHDAQTPKTFSISTSSVVWRHNFEPWASFCISFLLCRFCHSFCCCSSSSFSSYTTPNQVFQQNISTLLTQYSVFVKPPKLRCID